MATTDRWTGEHLLAAFDEHLRRTRGLCAGTRRNYRRYALVFLETVFADGPVDVGAIHVRDVVGFVGDLTGRYQPRTAELAASALRSFFRFLRTAGLRTDRLEDAVPMMPHRPSGLVRHLEPPRLTQLIASLDSGSPRGLRDRAIILCIARLGLRASEVAQLRLDDLDWRNAAVRVRTRKTGHGALLPLTAEVGTALADYLRRAGMNAPVRGANLLRHSLATDLLGRGASLREIAGVLGHASLATTRIYAAVDVEALREAALPWPQATS